MTWKMLFASAAAMLLPATAQAETALDGEFRQGGLVIGCTEPENRVTLDGRKIRVADDGTFLFGFHRDAPETALLQITTRDGEQEVRSLSVKARQYDVQRIDGLEEAKVTPPATVLERIRQESAAVRAVRRLDSADTLFRSGFIEPVSGRISGVYGSQRILNGKPRQPHYGIDIAAPAGTPVLAPADGIVVLAEPDLYFSGGTVILDHGHGLSSAFLHLARLDVEVGGRLKQGQRLGSVGATGRVTGPHLDWRVNWFDRRLDPALLVPVQSGSSWSCAGGGGSTRFTD